MWKPMALRKQNRRCTGKTYAQIESERKKKKTGSVYRIVKSSTIYTASFKHKCLPLFRTNHINVTSSAVRWKKAYI